MRLPAAVGVKAAATLQLALAASVHTAFATGAVSRARRAAAAVGGEDVDGGGARRELTFELHIGLESVCILDIRIDRGEIEQRARRK